MSAPQVGNEEGQRPREVISRLSVRSSGAGLNGVEGRVRAEGMRVEELRRYLWVIRTISKVKGGPGLRLGMGGKGTKTRRGVDEEARRPDWVRVRQGWLRGSGWIRLRSAQVQDMQGKRGIWEWARQRV